MFDEFVAVAETKQIGKPDGVGLPGEFHIRYVWREELAALFKRSGELGIVTDSA